MGRAVLCGCIACCTVHLSCASQDISGLHDFACRIIILCGSSKRVPAWAIGCHCSDFCTLSVREVPKSSPLEALLLGETVNLRRISPFGCITALSSFWMHYRIIFLLDAFILRFARSFLDLNFQDRLSQHHAMRFKFPSYRIGKFYVSLSVYIASCVLDPAFGPPQKL